MAKRITKTIISELNNKLVGISHPLIGINDVNDDSIDLINELWTTNSRFVVSCLDHVILNTLNTQMCNRSFSIDRWKITQYSELLNEPLNALICYKELSNEQTEITKANYLFTFVKKEGPRYVYIGTKRKEETDTREA